MPLAGAPEGLAARRLHLDEPSARELLRSLRTARAALVDRPAREVAAVLGGVGARFLDPGDALRAQALELLPPTAAYSAEMARAVLDGMAADWTAERLGRLLDLELAGGAALDDFVTDRAGRLARALGPPLTVHLCAGTVPGVSVTSMVRALLVKSAALLKPGRGDEVLPVLFRRALEEADPALAAASAVVYWPGGSREPLERLALTEADLLVVYGGDEAVRDARSRARGTTPVITYPHRVGFGVIGAAALSTGALGAAAAAAARAVALFEQRGCVSPHLFYVLGAETGAAVFADAVARALGRLERELPSGPRDPATASAAHQLRGTAELMSAAGRGRVWSGERASSWTVVLDPDPTFEPSCLARTVRIKSVASIDDLIDSVRPYRRHLQTVGVAGLDTRLTRRLGEGLAGLGGARIAPLEGAPWPPPWWHHDGTGPLASLVRWTDVEGGGG
jgi:hypothetical protein